MKCFYIALTVLFLFSFNQQSLADDVLIPFGGSVTTPTPPDWKYRGGNVDLFAQPWKTLAFDETGWATGASALGFGAGPAENTVIPQNGSSNSGASAPGAPYPTMYFRKTINISAAALAGYINFQLRTKFDDAIIVYVNGTEAYRSNIIINPSFTTYSNGTNTTYDNGNLIFTATIPSSFFVANDNIIAVEIHQNNATSSDLFFDLELTGIGAPPPTPPAAPAGSTYIFPFGAAGNYAGTAWKYLGGGTDLTSASPSWKDASFVDAAWLTSNTAFGFFGTGTIPPRSTVLPLNGTAGSGGASAGNPYPTIYFRKTINIANPNAYAAYKIRAMADDGLVIWINGVEAFKNNIISNPLYTTFASNAPTNGADTLSITIPTSTFVAGNNTIAVEVHQSSATSSDLFFDMELTGLATLSGTLTRGPYLQVGNQTGITIRWRTDVATNSRVTWGNAFGTYPNIVDSASLTTEHVVRVSGLTADTKYFYTIGSTTQTLQAANTNYVLTAPTANPNRKLRFSAIGDCGNASTNQVETKNALLNYIGINDIDATILLGDNAYGSGTDNEYQTGFFDIYKNDLLKNKKLYPAPGNHDYGNSSGNTGNVGNTDAASMPYHRHFSVPSAGECGGVASNSKAYYSFDIGNVHFLSLDSYGQQNANSTKLYDTLGAQALWVKNDLATNTKRWTVVYFHHPPYTKTSHNSDTEGDLEDMREDFIRILERYGVDLVLSGHSHGYERSYLLKNYYKANPGDATVQEPNFNFATHTANGNDKNAKYDGSTNSCAYTYNSGQYNHGSMYIVAGSAGQVGGQAAGYPHNAMYYSNSTEGGSLYFEVDSTRLDAKFISYTGTGATPTIRDQFTIFKDVNKVYNINATINTPINLSASWKGSYFWPDNANATTAAVTINNTALGSFTYRAKDASGVNCLEDIFNVTVTGTVPVSLISFDAKLNKNEVLLNWSTATEQNNKHFTIEKSVDGTQFNFLGRLNAITNATANKNYSLTDVTPSLGENFYRLSQTNVDNRITYLETKKVIYKGKNDFFVSVVNSTNQAVKLIINSSRNDKINMRVVDIMGREISQEYFSITAGVNNKNLALQKGIYVLLLSNSKGEKLTTKIIVP